MKVAFDRTFFRCLLKRLLPRGHASVDEESLTGDEARLRHREKFYSVPDVFWFSPSAGGDLGKVSGLVFFGVVGVSLDGDPAGSDHVDGDAEGGEFFGHGA